MGKSSDHLNLTRYEVRLQVLPVYLCNHRLRCKSLSWNTQNQVYVHCAGPCVFASTMFNHLTGARISSSGWYIPSLASFNAGKCFRAICVVMNVYACIRWFLPLSFMLRHTLFWSFAGSSMIVASLTLAACGQSDSRSLMLSSFVCQ